MNTPQKTPRNTLHRLLRHLFFTGARARRAFPPDTLKFIQALIARSEQVQRAEIRLAIEAALPVAEVFAGLTSRQRARRLFALHGIWDTQENTGILLYVNLADHRVEIIADRGVEHLIGKDQWHKVCQAMTSGFSRGEYVAGVEASLTLLSGLLAEVLPADGARDNELSNKPLML